MMSLVSEPPENTWLDGVTFDTSAWGPMTEVEGLRWWRAGEAAINLRFIDMAPDFEQLEAEYLRQTIIESMGLVQSHGWPIEGGIKFMPEAVPTENLLIDVEVDSIDGAPVVTATMRLRFDGKVRFGSTLMILFKTCVWTVRVEVEESAPIGEREAAVFRAVLEDPTVLGDTQVAVDPYQRRWDGLIDVGEDPLSRLRIILMGLVESIRLGPVTHQLEPFSGDG